jgi:hypothetical protein
VLHYIEWLIEKHAKNSTQEKPTKKRRVAGTMKGMFVLPLPDEFDEPLEDMKQYRSGIDYYWILMLLSGLSGSI